MLLNRKYAYIGIPAIYLVFGLLWIAVSDALLFTLATSFGWSSGYLEQAGKVKGFLYVIITSLLLGFLIRGAIRSVVSTKNDFKRLFAENPNPMWIYDVKTLKFLLVNNAACSAYGYSPEEFSRLTLYSIRPSGDYERLRTSVAATTPGYTMSRNWMHKGKNGSPFYVNIFSHDTVYAGKPCRIVTAININKERLAEIERDNLQRALDNSALVSITDLNGIILQANEKFCEVSGYREDELIGHDHGIVNSGYHPPEFWKAMWRTIGKGRPWRGDIKNKARDGSAYWVDTMINPVYNSAGKVYKFMSIRYLITERKKLEQQQLTLLNDLSDYAFHTSHELRGPVARMLGLVALFNDYPEKEFIVDKIKCASTEIDAVIMKMNHTLDRNAYPIMQGKEESRVKKFTGCQKS
jgi:PAS domain S-box-containing protein